MTEQIDTILFDLDGTLLDTLADLADAVNYSLTEMGYPIRSYDEIRMFLGNGAAVLMECSVPSGTLRDAIEQTLHLFLTYYAAHNRIKTAPYDGIVAMLTELKNAGYKLAVISNKFDAATRALSDLYFSEWISVAIGENEAENRRKKPHPDAVFEAIQQLGSEKSRCVFVGDSDVDVQTAANAGIPCISCTWGFRDKPFLLAHGATAERIISHPRELIPVIHTIQ